MTVCTGGIFMMLVDRVITISHCTMILLVIIFMLFITVIALLLLNHVCFKVLFLLYMKDGIKITVLARC